MNYANAYLLKRLERIAADNDRDNRRAANPEIVAARAAVKAAHEAYTALCAAQDAARAAINAAAVNPACAAADYIRTR